MGKEQERLLADSIRNGSFLAAQELPPSIPLLLASKHSGASVGMTGTLLGRQQAVIEILRAQATGPRDDNYFYDGRQV